MIREPLFSYSPPASERLNARSAVNTIQAQRSMVTAPQHGDRSAAWRPQRSDRRPHASRSSNSISTRQMSWMVESSTRSLVECGSTMRGPMLAIWMPG